MLRKVVMAFPDDHGEPQCRMVLERQLTSCESAAAWLMCNPSTADALVDDPTVQRVIRHTDRAGYSRSLVGNVWPIRTPYPRVLWERLRTHYPAEWLFANLDALAMIGGQASVHVVAFGAEPGRKYREAVELALDAFSCGGRHTLYCLGTTEDGMPLHPLARGHHFIPKDANLRRWVRPW